jgi:hypothetical protein
MPRPQKQTSPTKETEGLETPSLDAVKVPLEVAYIAIGRILQKSGYLGVPVAHTLSNGKKIVELVSSHTGDIIKVRYAPNFVGSESAASDEKRLSAKVVEMDSRVAKDTTRLAEAKETYDQLLAKLDDYKTRIEEQTEIVDQSNETLVDGERKVLARLEADEQVTRDQAGRAKAVLEGTEKELGDSELALLEATEAVENYEPRAFDAPQTFEIDVKANANLLIQL